MDLLFKKAEKITALTAYDYYTASIMDQTGLDIVLVGDSLGPVFLGYDSTIPVKLKDILYHTKAVARACKNSMVVSDIPKRWDPPSTCRVWQEAELRSRWAD